MTFQKEKIIRRLKSLGLVGFLFFLVKGLLWLAVIFGFTKFGGCEAL